MKRRLRQVDRLAGWAVALVALAVSVAPVYADSGITTFSILGNQFNPAGMQPGLAIDMRGMSQRVLFSRSPTGNLYPKPFLHPPMTQSQIDPAWWRTRWADIGVLANLSNSHPASFGEYGSWATGIVASAGFRAENRDTGVYVQGRAGGIGRDDQFYELWAGRYGIFNLGAYFKSIPHLLSTNARILWDGAGSANLRLPSGMAPGAVTAGEVEAELAAAPSWRLSTTRDQAGINAVYMPSDEWELYLNLANEWRDGVRPIGSTFFFPARGAAELVQPVKYRTVEISAGARFKSEAVQVNLSYAGSFFRNDFATLTWENPALGTTGFIPERGRISLAPDNDYHVAKGDLAWAVSRVRLAGSISYNAMLQNEALSPHKVNSGLTPVDLSLWNTVASLSQPTADAAIETFDGFAQLSLTATSDLSVIFEARYRDQENSTNYLSLNPSTMQYGYVGLDGALSRIYSPSAAGSDVPIRNIPFATDKLDIMAKADYRFTQHTRLNFSYAHKTQERRYREVARSDDNAFSGQISSAGYEWGTVRVNYEYASRSGSDYVPNPYRFARSAGLPGYLPRATGDVPYALSSFRKYDVSDRVEHLVRVQTNFIVSLRSDLQFSGTYRNIDYDADFGLRKLSSLDMNANFASQLTDAATASAYYSFQSHRREVASINPARSASGDDGAGGPNFPIGNVWDQAVNDVNHMFGMDIHYTFDSVSVDMNYTYSIANSEFSYAYASLGAISSALTAAEAGSAFPDETFQHHVFEVSVLWPYTERILLRGYYRLEHEELADFHYSGLTNVVGNHVYLGAVPENYTANVIGVFTQFRF